MHTCSSGLTRPLQLYTDFDGTLTTVDTLSALSQLPRTPYKPWSYFVDAYLKDLELYLPLIPVPESPSPDNRTTLPQEAEYLASYLPIERRSVERLERAKYFAGFSAAQLRQHGFESVITGVVGIRDGWWELLACLNKHHIKHTISVISVNWSAEFIRGVLSGSYRLWCHQQGFTPTGSLSVVDTISIYSNDLLISHETHLTTGNFSRRYPAPVDRGIWTAEDKLDVMTELLNNTPQHTNAVTIYMGDSPLDLLCLLKADMGIIVGRGKELVETCNRLGLLVEEGRDGPSVRGEVGSRLFRIEIFGEVLKWFKGCEGEVDIGG